MPRLEDVKITGTMVKAALMYEEGDNTYEIAKALKRTREYIVWALRVQKIPVDDATLTPTGRAGKRFAQEWDAARFKIIGGRKK